MKKLITKKEAIEICKMGQGADCCFWLVMGPDGFKCLYEAQEEGRTLTGQTMRQRLDSGLTVAKRDGCEEMISRAIKK